ncbi:metalloregulator ArsR/SmtB family transcription factor [Bacillus shivajii]|uniref:ArsR/SmtB family transcription factor n=1 Tax=Bacillus shivajii TaxID=1983719 RepID=UPI001CF991F9|nr:metalloregulator ArsR/SmtB family transcription factor [Bacillus shivajii]UCZ53607.1 metalloregulator ArsR/SmtB family transcription factor [Bacillus shivajii]
MTAAPKHDVFQAIADPSRRKILQLLAEKERPISEISEHFPITRTAVVKHLTILSEAELVKSEKLGREKWFSLQPEPLRKVKDWVAYYEQFWENKLSMLKHFVEESENENELAERKKKK